MAERSLPFGQITPVARPIGAFVQPAQAQPAGPARPSQLDSPVGISAIAIQGTSGVRGFNQFEQLAEALAPFNRALTETVSQGYLSYRKGQIEEGYFDELKNQRAKAMLSLQVQAETGAADAASQIGELEKKDPVAAQLLDEANPWKLIGRRRAVAQMVGPEISRVLEDDLSANAGQLSTMRPDSPEIEKRRVQLTAQVLDRYGLTGDEPEVQFYVTPKLNEAWDRYRDQQRKFYDAAVEESTRNTTVAATAATLEEMLTKGVTVQGATFAPGSPEWLQYGAATVTYGLDQQLRLLSPEARKRTIQFLREQVIGTFGSDPMAAALLQQVRGGDPSMPYEKRPTWGAMAPLETLELQVRGQEAAQKTYDLRQQTIERKLDEAWNEGPGSMDRNDPGYIQAVGQVRALGAAMGYADIDAYLVRKAKGQSEFMEVVRPPDPFAAEDFIAQIEQVAPGAWTDDPNAYKNALQQAKEIAAASDPTPEGQREAYQRMKAAIDKARAGAAEFDAGVKDRVTSAVLQDLDSQAVREIKNEQKVNGKSGDALAQALAQRMAGGATATQAISATYQNTKLTAAANRLTALYERALSTAIRNWKAERPGQVMSPAARSVVMSEAEAAVRKSPEWAQAMRELTDRNPGEVGPRAVGTDPRNARGVPRAGARSLPDSTVRNYQSRPVMDGKWLREELVQLQQNKPVSPELYNMAVRANTSTFRYLLEQLRFYPKLDPSGDAKRWLEEKVKRQRAARTVSSNQLPGVVGATVGAAPAGYNPLAPGGWLMRLLTPPAAAATLPPGFGGGGRPLGGSPGQFERPESVVYERPGPGNQPGVDYWFPSKRFPAVLSGRVKDIGRDPGYGNYVVVESVDPRNGQKVDVLYGHLPDDGIFVRRGQTIGAGQVIGRQGGTGNVRSADGTIASVDFFAPRPAGSRDMTPYRDFDGLRRHVTGLLQRGGGTLAATTRRTTTSTMTTPAARRGGGMTGLATYYTGSGGQDGVAGGPTANGERYNPRAMTAAVQWSLRGKYLNKWLIVEDLETGRKVRVWANDVGPMGGDERSVNQKDPRIVDLSPAAFERLFGGLNRGVGRIRVRIDANQRRS